MKEPIRWICAMTAMLAAFNLLASLSMGHYWKAAVYFSDGVSALIVRDWIRMKW